MRKNTERFTDRVDNYIKYRPHYPPQIISFLRDTIHLTTDWIVADIGSGTGISSELFLSNKNKVYGVEPNQSMRLAAENLLQKYRNFTSINGTAEATTLPKTSIDLIVAGQAFHWFDKDKAKPEFQRITKPKAYLLLMWNDRRIDSPFLQAYEELLNKYALDYKEVNNRNVDENVLKAFYAPHHFHTHTLKNTQSFDFDALKGRLLSSSYAPLENHPNYKPMLAKLEQIFEKYNSHAKVQFEYNCNLYFGKIH